MLVSAPMLLRLAFAFLAVALTACSGQVASGVGGDGGHENPDSGHPGSDAGNGHDSGLAPPTNHRPTHDNCSATRPPGLQDGGGMPFCAGETGSCVSDSECPVTSDAGTNGRCTPNENSGPAIGCPTCQYDQCSNDSQCGTGSVCECGGDAPAGRFPNGCVTGNCQVDSDCGSGGYCSPNVGFCFEGTLGYYCHTAGDQCHNNSDCQDMGLAGGQCVYDSSKKIWDCQGEECPG
jgi:hypothetical protein